ncbi:MAG: T9SS type A sorting domain-containing protein [Chitinophagaceae bacterium]|nr:T9SS type A sorting domain-containing protein [Chitinophagaceae bacterium]
MKLKTTLSIIFLSAFLQQGYSQASRIVFSDNGIATISGGAFVVVDNPEGNAITRINGGHFITEGDLGTNRVRWMIGDKEDTYVVPFGVSTNQYLPLSFSTFGANGQGFIDLSTYATDSWKNSDYLPAGVTSFNNANNQDNSANVLDRFYRIEALNYTAKPNLDSIEFSYRDIEHTQPNNMITEAGLKAQRWNPNQQGWADFQPAGIADIDKNTVQVGNINNADLFAWWVLVDNASPLPVELLSFTAFAESKSTVGLKWSTSQEINSGYFDIERSADGINFIKTGQIKAAGNSQIQQNYYTQDNNLPQGISTLYYRLKMIDIDNSYKYSNIELVKINTQQGDWKLYPNPVSLEAFAHLQVPSGINVKEIQCFDAQGKLMSQVRYNQTNTNGSYTLQLPVQTLSSGSYVMKVIYTDGIGQKI